MTKPVAVDIHAHYFPELNGLPYGALLFLLASGLSLIFGVMHRANKLSGGEQQMLAIGRALMSNPALLLMDEPTEGLAPLLGREVGRVIGELEREGLSILLVEQNLPLAAAVADRVHVLNRGEIVYSGAPGALLANEEVQSRYLGVA